MEKSEKLLNEYIHSVLKVPNHQFQTEAFRASVAKTHGFAIYVLADTLAPIREAFLSFLSGAILLIRKFKLHK